SYGGGDNNVWIKDNPNVAKGWLQQLNNDLDDYGAEKAVCRSTFYTYIEHNGEPVGVAIWTATSTWTYGRIWNSIQDPVYNLIYDGPIKNEKLAASHHAILQAALDPAYTQPRLVPGSPTIQSQLQELRDNPSLRNDDLEGSGA